jgi:ElaB/YqjD/DUF883 family membrane-anchored ribosome-binding protein
MNQMPGDNTKEKLFQEFHAVVAETEHLIKTAAGAGNEKAAELKASFGNELAAATERLARLRDQTIDQCSAVAKTTDAYVHDNPWRSVGIVATIAVAAGLVAGMLIARR